MREDSKPRRRPMSRFNDRAKRVLGMAGSEATRLHRDIVEPEHVLLGLLTCGGIPAKVLEDSGVKLEEARRAVEAMTGHGDKVEVPSVAPAPGTWTIIELAADEADLAGEEIVRPEHVLLALVRQPGSATPVLDSFGVSGDLIRQRLASAPSGS
ncbi:MAG: ATP-dependent Clp protease ATP-binding subunit [Chloroflexi bacterium]|nr:MAG: ATP-dependent Clp protease ATP-binding subunit [Chloroflexota bacterium]